MDERRAMKRHGRSADRRESADAGSRKRPRKPGKTRRSQQGPDQGFRTEAPTDKSSKESRGASDEIRRRGASGRARKREQLSAESE